MAWQLVCELRDQSCPGPGACECGECILFFPSFFPPSFSPRTVSKAPVLLTPPRSSCSHMRVVRWQTPSPVHSSLSVPLRKVTARKSKREGYSKGTAAPVPGGDLLALDGWLAWLVTLSVYSRAVDCHSKRGPLTRWGLICRSPREIAACCCCCCCCCRCRCRWEE